ncbi:hypothetical protein ACSSS7_000241 [Eimeria intestinalis]
MVQKASPIGWRHEEEAIEASSVPKGKTERSSQMSVASAKKLERSSPAPGDRQGLQSSPAAFAAAAPVAAHPQPTAGSLQQSAEGEVLECPPSVAIESEVSAVMTEQMVWQFLCPTHLKHPAVLQRLFLLGIYGNLDLQGRMRGASLQRLYKFEISQIEDPVFGWVDLQTISKFPEVTRHESCTGGCTREDELMMNLLKAATLLPLKRTSVKDTEACTLPCAACQTQLHMTPAAASFVRNALLQQRVSLTIVLLWFLWRWGAAVHQTPEKRKQQRKVSFYSSDKGQKPEKLQCHLAVFTANNRRIHKYAGKRLEAHDVNKPYNVLSSEKPRAQPEDPTQTAGFWYDRIRAEAFGASAAVSDLATMDEKQLAANITLIRYRGAHL